MKKQLSICFSALAITAIAISAPQTHQNTQHRSPVILNDTMPGKNKGKFTDSAKEWHNNADNPRDSLYPRRDSSGHPKNSKDTTLHLPR